MWRMGPFQAPRGVLFSALSLALLTGGCSHPVAVPGDNGAAQPAAQATPFQQGRTKPDDGDEEATASDGKAAPVPFHDRKNLPAGTLISVRLKAPISVEDAQASDPFQAVVVDPVVVEGDTLIPSGTLVSGRVESARISKLRHNRGYVRLALASVHMAGLDVPVQTASLFARQSPLIGDSPSSIGLEKGRRLTFSLTEPAYLAAQRNQASH